MDKFNYVIGITSKKTGPVCKLSISSESLCDYNKGSEEIKRNAEFISILFISTKLHDLTIKKDNKHVKGFNVYMEILKGVLG